MCFSTVEELPKLEHMVFCTVISAEKQPIQNMEHGLDQEYSNLQLMLFFVTLINCKCIEDSPVVNDLQRHEKYIELEMHKHFCSKVVKNMQRRQNTM